MILDIINSHQYGISLITSIWAEMIFVTWYCLKSMVLLTSVQVMNVL